MGANFAPVIPGLNDHEMAAERGATSAGMIARLFEVCYQKYGLNQNDLPPAPCLTT